MPHSAALLRHAAPTLLTMFRWSCTGVTPVSSFAEWQARIVGRDVHPRRDQGEEAGSAGLDQGLAQAVRPLSSQVIHSAQPVQCAWKSWPAYLTALLCCVVEEVMHGALDPWQHVSMHRGIL